MQEVSKFIQTALSSQPNTTPDEAKKVADTYEGLAQVFQRIADDVRVQAGRNGDVGAGKGSEGAVGVLLDFAEKGKNALSEVKKGES